VEAKHLQVSSSSGLQAKAQRERNVRVILAIWRVAPYNFVAVAYHLSGFHRHASVKIDFIFVCKQRDLSVSKQE
jgi:hypothetical protein